MIGFVGGTGPEGKGLALRFALGGEDVFVGSRDANRSDTVVAEIARHSQSGKIHGGLNSDAAREADIIFLTILLYMFLRSSKNSRYFKSVILIKNFIFVLSIRITSIEQSFHLLSMNE